MGPFSPIDEQLADLRRDWPEYVIDHPGAGWWTATRRDDETVKLSAGTADDLFAKISRDYAGRNG